MLKTRLVQITFLGIVLIACDFTTFVRRPEPQVTKAEQTPYETNTVRISPASDLPLTPTSQNQTRTPTATWPTEIPLWSVPIRESRLLLRDSSWIESIAFSPDGKTLATGGGKYNESLKNYDARIKLWNATNGMELRSFIGHTNKVEVVVFSPDGKKLASGGIDRTVRLWDLATGKELFILKRHQDMIRDIAFSPDGTTLASAGDDRRVILWNVITGKELRTLEDQNMLSVYGVAFSSDGKTLASVDLSRSIKFWDFSTGTKLRSLSGHTDSVNAVAFSPDSKFLATGSDDMTAKIWDVKSGQVLFTLNDSQHICRVIFSPDGKLLASRDNSGGIMLWDVKTGKPIQALGEQYSPVCSLAFTLDSKFLVAGSQEGVELWDLSKLR